MADPNKPHLILASLPIYGHTMPLRAIARGLLAQGFPMTFLTGSHYAPLITSIGATFSPLSCYADFSESTIPSRFPARAALFDAALSEYDQETIFIRSMPDQFRSLVRVVKEVREREKGERKVIVVTECGFFGAVPFLLGARDGEGPDACVTIGVLPLAVSSVDTAPFGFCVPPDGSPEGRKRNRILYEKLKEKEARLQAAFEEGLAEVGVMVEVGKEVGWWSDVIVKGPERYIQMCVPDIEYPRSDLPPNIRFAGGLPRGARDPSTSLPLFWDELLEVHKHKSKKILAVSQGTFSNSPTQLLLPTISSLGDDLNLLVIAVLGSKGATLPPEIAIGPSVRVAGFIPFDELLPYCDVFVTNGGYGAVGHAIANGCPMVVAGSTEEKPENAARVEWSGIGVDLKTGTPTGEMVREAVVKVLGDKGFKEKVERMKGAMEGYMDPVGMIGTQILEVVGWRGREARG
jgi:UDP:flavonoid glycosyltransferase YjiC (YdhE family)